MSTYVVAFVMGTFDFIEAKTSSEVKCKIFTPIGRSKEAKFALNICTKLVSVFEQFFGIPYPLPKLDMVAIPDSLVGKV